MNPLNPFGLQKRRFAVRHHDSDGHPKVLEDHGLRPIRVNLSRTDCKTAAYDFKKDENNHFYP